MEKKIKIAIMVDTWIAWVLQRQAHMLCIGPRVEVSRLQNK